MTISDEKIIFSVVIPTYNHARFINRCIDSIISQTYTNWEAIIVNNFSADNTIELIEAYNDPRLRIVNFKNNGIIGASRNIGIKSSKGESICFLDSDDWWYPNKLEIVYQYILNNPKIDVICHDLILNDLILEKKYLLPCGPVVPNLYRDLLIHGNRFPNSALSIKKSTLESNNITICETKEIVSVEDYDLSLQLASCNANFACLNIPLGEYLIENNNISGSKIHEINLEFLLRKHVFEVQTFEPNKNKLWIEVCSRLNFIKGISRFRQHKYTESMRYFLQSFKSSQINFIKYVSDRAILSLKRIRKSSIAKC